MCGTNVPEINNFIITFGCHLDTNSIKLHETTIHSGMIYSDSDIDKDIQLIVGLSP